MVSQVGKFKSFRGLRLGGSVVVIPFFFFFIVCRYIELTVEKGYGKRSLQRNESG